MRRVGHDLRLASNPTVGNLMDKLVPEGATLCFGETSELTGCGQVCAERAADEATKKKFLDTWSSYNDFINRHKTNDLSESQPTKGNIEGGLSTIEERAFGNFMKTGHDSKFIDVLEPAEEPSKGPGLYYMDTSSAAAECVTLMCAAGFVMHLFTTGQGNIIGNPVEPVLKLSANPRTVRTMSEHIDLDVSGILRREMDFDQAGDALIDSMITHRLGFKPSPIVLGLILGPIAEQGFVQGWMIGGATGDPLSIFLAGPLTITIVVLIFASLFFPLVTGWLRQRRNAEETPHDG